jgi:nicotinamide mononucleotide adenylyltransferase
VTIASAEKMKDLLKDFLGNQLQEVIEAYISNENVYKYFVEIPEVDVVDLGIDNIASLVARTSNVYGRAARFAGMARAQLKILEGSFEKVYKLNMTTGKNEDERKAFAMKAAEEQHSEYIVCQAIVSLAESIESAARIASESARKLMDKIQSMQVAAYREEKGSYLESDFSTY